VAQTRARVFEYAVTLDEGWSATSDRGGERLSHDDEAWTPEHLLLTALARCSLTSFRYHARRAGLDTTATAAAQGSVTTRESDGRFAFVEIEVRCVVTLTPPADAEATRALVDKAERDCFVGASLAVAPRYMWTVNGQELA
jgi:organic hydroperoxide reductase OsmC/OhrA